jgi:DNA-binding CsgD family transcriptional regulator
MGGDASARDGPDASPGRETVLLGRRKECAELDELLRTVRAGEGQCLVLRGEPGIGKTALLGHLAGRASGCRLARAAGVQSEMELPFAGLHQLCAPMLDRLDHLPGPQRAALATAFGLSEGDPPDRFLVGLAVLSLLSGVAEQQPLLCLVDDAQWLDVASAQALSFVARRLLAESLGVVFAVRQGDTGEQLPGLPELVLEGLPAADARVLLSAAFPGPLDERIRDRIVAETRGNPLAVLELPHGMSPAALAGGFGLPNALPLQGHIEDSFARRLRTLPTDTQRLLLAAAAESVGDPRLLFRAAQAIGIGSAAAAEAESAGLLEIGLRVRFRHPLVRSAAYRSASADERRAVHRALADATDPGADPDRRAWHRAQAAAAPDEEVAHELELSAARAQRRGGVAAAAAFLERAAVLSPDPHRRAIRAMAAAEAKVDAGAPDSAHGLLEIAATAPLGDLERSRLERLRARITFLRGRGSDAPPLLLAAARRLHDLDAALARETYLDALGAAIFASFLADEEGIADLVRAARAAPAAPDPARPSDLLLDGLAARFTEGYSAAVPVLRRALDAFAESRSDHDLQWLWLACRVAPALWDDERWHALTGRLLALARERGALAAIPLAATYRAGIEVHAGEFAAAARLIEEADSITAAIGVPELRYSSLMLAAWRGEESEVSRLRTLAIEEATARGEGRAITLAECSAAVLYNGLGRHDASAAAAGRAAQHDDIGLYGWALHEQIEAGVCCGDRELATGALERLTARTRVSRTDWALGVEARSRALLSDGERAEGLYREAIERLGHTRIAVHLARAHLVYGEWLCRERRRGAEAHVELRTAHDMFTRMGAHGFAARAERELGGSARGARRPRAERPDHLTPQEARIALLARDGLTNPEIAAQLFISPRTVEYHLHKVFAKLRIGSRGELGRALTAEPRPALTA